MDKVDVIISGAGMVGAITALNLSKSGMSVYLIDQAEASQMSEQSPPQLRVSAVSRRNLNVLSQLGVMQTMHQNRLGYYKYMSVWDNRTTGALDFKQGTGPDLGAIIENQHITSATQQVIASTDSIKTRYKTKITQSQCNDRKVKVTLSDGHQIEAGLLLVAEGAKSPLREQAEIEIQTKDYQQKGLVFHISMDNAPAQTALQAFNQTGPVGLLPMNDGLFSVVWSLPNDQVEYWRKVDQEKFIHGLKAHINRPFGKISLISERAAFPLRQMNAKHYFKDRMVLLGDSAHTIHPLAGQGVNLGIEDGQCLTELLSGVNLKSHDEVRQVLKKYQRRRKAEVFKTSELMNVIHHMFTSNNPILGLLRSQGMHVLNKVSPLKNWLVEQAGS